MFNWEKFKEGKIAVHCDTKEKAIDFLNECERHLIERAKINIRRLDDRIFEDGIGYSCGIDYNKLEFDSLEYYEKEYETIIKWNIKENNMEKTFREVIADIKEGEVWENENRKITINDLGEIFIKDKITGLRSFNPKVKYKLQRREYTFEEAFKAYEEGKEIQSASTDKIYHKEKDFLFASYEISKKWYINN